VRYRIAEVQLLRRTSRRLSFGHHESWTPPSNSVQSGKYFTEFKDGKLTVNGKPYGAVEDGATVVIEENGKIMINGKERLPE
jgi:hypothetical protein